MNLTAGGEYAILFLHLKTGDQKCLSVNSATAANLASYSGPATPNGSEGKKRNKTPAAPNATTTTNASRNPKRKRINNLGLPS